MYHILYNIYYKDFIDAFRQKMIELCQELGISREMAAGKVMEKFSFDIDEVQECMEKYWK